MQFGSNKMCNVYMRWMLDADNISQQSDKVNVKLIKYIGYMFESITYNFMLNVIVKINM